MAFSWGHRHVPSTRFSAPGYVCWAFARAYAPDVLQPFVVDLASALIQATDLRSCGEAGAAKTTHLVPEQYSLV